MLEGTFGAPGSLTGLTETWRARARGVESDSRRRDLLARLAAMSLAGFGRRLDAARDVQSEATAVARAWLELVDAGRPSVSWIAAAPTLRETIAPEEWEAALGGARAPAGRCRSRRVLSRATVEAFPGVPPGPYTVVHFQSDFEQRPGVIETVTTCLGADGRWRVAAYFIRHPTDDVVKGPSVDRPAGWPGARHRGVTVERGGDV